MVNLLMVLLSVQPRRVFQLRNLLEKFVLQEDQSSMEQKLMQLNIMMTKACTLEYMDKEVPQMLINKTSMISINW